MISDILNNALLGITKRFRGIFKREKEEDTDVNVILSAFTITTIILMVITFAMRSVQKKSSFGRGLAVDAKSVLEGGGVILDRWEESMEWTVIFHQ